MTINNLLGTVTKLVNLVSTNLIAVGFRTLQCVLIGEIVIVHKLLHALRHHGILYHHTSIKYISCHFAVVHTAVI